MFARLARRPCHCSSRIFSLRYSSTSNISEDRMRALISLYHQSETFITKETLDQRIDDAFTKEPKHVTSGDASQLSLKTMNTIIAERKLAPYFVDWVDVPGSIPNDIGSRNAENITEALYDVEVGHGYFQDQETTSDRKKERKEKPKLKRIPIEPQQTTAGKTKQSKR
ncbi:hypothetical protein DL96DRAFT_1592092 [Flagelloscypha sp. PMI_526]|nr:hypothetical protein DL96DRAFT_1592092 [Flagelloscypha sp. PMI_526]